MKQPRDCLCAALLLTSLVLWVDAPLTRLIHRNLTPAMDALFDNVSEIAATETYSLLALSAYGVGLWALAMPAARRWTAVLERLVRGGLFMLLTMLTGGVIVWALKHMVARSRPFMLLEQAYYGVAAPFSGSPFNSFPSSHALTAFVVAAVLGRLLPPWRLPLLLLASMVAACRILTLEHYLSDVVVAALIAMVCTRFWAPRVLHEHTRWPLRHPWRWHKP